MGMLHRAEHSRALAQGALRLLGYRAVRASGRAATIFPDDRLLVSYPRSGNTWLSFLLTTVVNLDDPTTFSNLESRCPDIHQHPDRYLWSLPRPRLLKSHEAFDPRYPAVVYLVRDPRDVAVSLYRFMLKTRALPAGFSPDAFVEGYVAGRWLAEFGTWREHVGSWTGARGPDASFLLLRYEDLHADPAAWLVKTAEFLELPVTGDECRRAVELCTPERMRELERRESAEDPVLKRTRQDIPFVGSAEVGRGASELTGDQQAVIAEAWGASMSELGYGPAVPAPE